MKDQNHLVGVVSLFSSVAGVLALAGSACAQGAPNGSTGGTNPVNIEPRFVYVSSIVGNDSNSGLSPGHPKRTLAGGFEQLRMGYPDQLLLRRGDTWVGENPYPTGMTWNKSGYSPTQPMVMGAYGDADARPVVRSGTLDQVVRFQTSAGIRYVTIRDIEFLADRDATNRPIGIYLWADGGWFTIDNCKVSGFQNNINIDCPSQDGSSNIIIRNTQILDSFANPGAHSQGIYIAHINGALVDHCVIDSNGWRYPDRVGTTLNHDCYFEQTATNIVIQDSIVARGSATGIQLRGRRQDAIRNLVLQNPLGITMGHPLANASQTSTGRIWGNVVLDAADIGWGSLRQQRGFGIAWGRVDHAAITDNIVAHGVTQTAIDPAYSVSDFSRHVDFSRNVGLDWRGPIFSVRTWIEPTTTISQNTFVNFPTRITGQFEFSAGVPSDVGGEWGGNTYYGGGWQMFVANMQATGLTGWTTRTDDVVEINDSGLLNANVSMPTYLLTQCPDEVTPPDAASAVEVFMQRARSGEVINTDPRFTAEAVIRWARRRLGVGELGSVPAIP